MSSQRMLRALGLALAFQLAPWQPAAAELAFPEDHGSHPDHRLESWYFSGRLEDDDGGAFAFHLGFFRVQVKPERSNQPGEGESAWRFSEIIRGELGLTDLKGKRFHAAERLSRAALDLAGTRSDPFTLWVHDWRLELSVEASSAAVFRLRADDGPVQSLELDVHTVGARLISGAQPLSRSGVARAGLNGYAMTRMTARGTLDFDGRAREIRGEVWLDRLWRTLSFDQVKASLGETSGGAFLTSGQIAFNRFALRLDNGLDLLLFQMHRVDGSGEPVASGVLVNRDGSTTPLSAGALTLREIDHWKSEDGRRYPAAWRIGIPAEEITLDVRPPLADQEVRASVRYWSGAVALSGKANGREVTGFGHAVLAGYGKRGGD